MTSGATYRDGLFRRPGGLQLYYRDFPGAPGSAGAPVVCLHGWWRTSKDFIELAQHLSSGRRVIAPDLPGRGRSDYATDVRDYHFANILDDLEGLLDHLEVASAVFVGLTLGAMLGMELARHSPGRVLGLVLNDTGAAPPPPKATQRMRAFAGGDELSFDGALAQMRRASLEHSPTLSQASLVRLVQRAYRRTASGGYVRDFDQAVNAEMVRFKASRPHFWAEYRALAGLPMLILRGENSDYLTPDVAERMLRENSSAALAVVRDRGHAPMLDEPEAIGAITAFVERLEQGLRAAEASVPGVC